MKVESMQVYLVASSKFSIDTSKNIFRHPLNYHQQELQVIHLTEIVLQDKTHLNSFYLVKVE